jgi:small subunit ribosomal protein S16
MPVKIRLQRHGKKGSAFFHIVIADGRAPRDGKFIEKIGTYNPNTNPATIELNNEKALNWLKNGAQPTDTAKAILSYKGVLLKLHLEKGVGKGALTQEQADAKFENWLQEKQSKIEGKVTKLSTLRADQLKKKLNEEQERNARRQAEIAAKNAPPAPEPEAAVEEAESVAVETASEESTNEGSAPVAEVEQAVAESAPAEVANEASAPVAEASENTPEAPAEPEA